LRIKLFLQSDSNSFLNFNYFYPLSAAVYKLLKFGSPEFSSFLHDIGYKLNGKSFKLFTFALRFEKFKIQNSSIKLLSTTSYLYISSPLVDDFIQNFVIGTFESQKIEIAASGSKSIYAINQVESMPEIVFKEEMKFKLLSPLILSTKKEHNGKLKPYYLRFNDNPEDLERILNNNLANKYELITGKKSENKSVSFNWDYDYIKKSESKNKKLTKKQTIKQGTSEETEVIGNQIPFTITGDKDLIKVGYECGFGEKNSLGFGMADTDSTD
jgi:CRISPR-associated endoribonuclease Cas6